MTSSDSGAQAEQPIGAEERRRQRLRDTTIWAEAIRRDLQAVLDSQRESPVHFRPSSNGVAMVGLLHDRPQRGKSGLRDLRRVANEFAELYAKHCRDVEQGKEKGEKALQSFLLREAYRNERRLAPINAASMSTNDPVELVFIADEIRLPVDGPPPNEIVCDLLALRRDGGRVTPVVLELKDDRLLTRLVQQVSDYAALVDRHAEDFAALFSAVLGEPVRFDAPTEKWIVWPASKQEREPREGELREMNVRVVCYTEPAPGQYELWVGDR